MFQKILKIILAIGLTCSLSAVATAEVEKWPNKNVRIVVPFSAGGVADVISRIIGQEFSQAWGVPVVVENLPGANGNIGMAQLVRQPADGHTIIMAPDGNLAINQHLFKDLPFDVYRDVEPVVVVADSDNLLVTSASSGFKDFDDFREYAKSRQGGITYASPGVGSTHHLAGVLLGKELDVEALHVPYKGFAPALNDIVTGEVDAMFVSIATAEPFIKSGRIQALAVGSLSPATLMPEVTPLAELGYPDFDAVSWYSFVVRKGTDPKIVDKIYKTTKTAIENTQDKFTELGLVPSGRGPSELAALIKSDDERWGQVVEELGIEKQ